MVPATPFITEASCFLNAHYGRAFGTPGRRGHSQSSCLRIVLSTAIQNAKRGKERERLWFFKYVSLVHPALMLPGQTNGWGSFISVCQALRSSPGKRAQEGEAGNQPRLRSTAAGITRGYLPARDLQSPALTQLRPWGHTETWPRQPGS